MDSFKNAVAFWATVLGTVVGVIGVFQSLGWLVFFGALIGVTSLGVLIYAVHQRNIVNSARVRIEGRSLDSLNLASLQRRLNRSLAIQRVRNMARIDGEDLMIVWNCSGYCLSQQETAIEFSIDADTNIPFNAFDCVAFDIRHDPRRSHPIQPLLIGPDGSSKKLSVPFLSPLSAREPFNVTLHCRLPGCLSTGFDYYTATLSFDQDTIPQYEARLRFSHGDPRWVRLYECREPGNVQLLKDLRGRGGGPGVREFVDHATDVPGQAIRVYAFYRDSIQSATEHRQGRRAA